MKRTVNNSLLELHGGARVKDAILSFYTQSGRRVLKIIPPVEDRFVNRVAPDWADAIDYLELRFTTTTTVEVWAKATDEELRKDSAESCIVLGNDIDIDNDSAAGTIDGQKMYLKPDADGPFLFA